MAEYKFDNRPKEPLVFEPLLPPQDYTYATGAEFNAAAQNVFVQNWQILMRDAPPVRDEYESGGWGCNTDIVINHLFTVILKKDAPTQRDAYLATSMIRWLGTYAGQQLIKVGQHLQSLCEESYNKLTHNRSQWPEDHTDEREIVRALANELVPNAMLMLWSLEQHKQLSARTWGIVPDWQERPHSEVDSMTTAEFIALQPANFNDRGDLISLPTLTEDDRKTFDAIARWLGRSPQYIQNTQNMISGQEFLGPCLEEIAQLKRAAPPISTNKPG